MSFSQPMMTFSNASLNRGVDPTPFAHWDMSDLASITKDGSDRVSQIDDQTANNNDLVQATGGNQPLWLDNDQNGIDVVHFDGGAWMRDSWSALSQPVTIFMALREPTNSGSFDYVFDNAATNNFYNLKYNTADKFEMHAGGSVTFTEVGHANVWEIATMIFDGVSSDFRINGISEASGNVGSNTMNGITLAAARAENLISDMKVGEIYIFDQLVSDTFRDALEASLATKWGT